MDKKRKDSQRAIRRFKQLLRETPLGGRRDTVWNDPRIRYVDSDRETTGSVRGESPQSHCLDEEDFGELEIN